MRKIIIIGDDRHIENVVKENRGRVDRGYISISEEGAEAKTEAPKPEKKKASKPAKKVSKPIEKKMVDKVPDTKQAPKPDTKDVNPESK